MTSPKHRRSAGRGSPVERLLHDGPELVFFTGKGGVGKTTLAASYALWHAHAERSKRLLLISTDPAHSLGDVLERKLPPRPVELRLGKARLTVHEVDAESRFRTFLDQHRDRLVMAIESGTIFSREEIEPLLSSTLPGMAEMAALLAIDDALGSGKFDCIVVDTAPFGHTIRLFQLPEAFQKLLRFLEVASSRDAVLAAHFGGHAPAPNPLLAEWQGMLESLLIDLRARARLILVTTPEPFALQESVRVDRIMANMSPPLRFGEIVLNRAVKAVSGCAVCNAHHGSLGSAQRFLARSFPHTARRIAFDPGMPIAGSEMLLRFGQQVFAGKPGSLKPETPPSSSKPRMRSVQWPLPAQQLSITVGKGGVGKTTISAAMAVHLRSRKHGLRVAVCSTDPAPSLDDVFAEPVGDDLHPVAGDRGLLAAEIDAPAAFHAWAARMKQKIAGSFGSSEGGVHIDLGFERQVFEALLDVVPPGLDEVFGVLRLSEFLPATGRKSPMRLILDMAPTGHALELLRTPDRILHWTRLLLKSLAVHRSLPFAREIGTEVAAFSRDVRYLAERLHRPGSTAAWAIMLAEPLPDRETERLLEQLHLLRVPVAGVIVNRLMPLDDLPSCGRCRLRRAWQWFSLAKLRKSKALGGITAYAVREQAGSISGRTALEALTRQLWQLL